jgi:hypothetical protein
VSLSIGSDCLAAPAQVAHSTGTRHAASAAVHLLTALERRPDALWVRWSAVESGPALTHPAVMDQQAEALEQWLDRIQSSDVAVPSQAASDLAPDRPSAQRRIPYRT